MQLSLAQMMALQHSPQQSVDSHILLADVLMTQHKANEKETARGINEMRNSIINRASQLALYGPGGGQQQQQQHQQHNTR